MALWFEPELQFDIPDSNVLLPAASFGLNTTDTDRFDEVLSLHSMMYGSLFSNAVCEAFEDRNFRSSSGEESIHFINTL
jgi:hypothetical protein